MSASDTKGELLAHLNGITRELNPDSMNVFTTARIATDCNVSRNLASQYLNELVREGSVVKVGGRPVTYFHRRALERYLQVRLETTEFVSMRDLLAVAGERHYHDFEKAIGADQSLGACVEQLKSAMEYPPCGLPVLLVGEHGTGKALLAQLAFEYGMNTGALPAGAAYATIDCSRYEEDERTFMRDVFGDGGVRGAVQRVSGGMVYLHRFDHLSRMSTEMLLSRVTEGARNQGDDARPAHFILGTARPIDNSHTAAAARVLPIVVTLPRYRDRTEDERTALVMHYLRAEGRRVAADVSISRGALRALVNADFAENLDSLRSCVTTCCAGAYLDREGEILAIRPYNLPSYILGSSSPQPDDDQLVSCAKRTLQDPASRVTTYFQRVVDSYRAYQEHKLSLDEFLLATTDVVHGYKDFQNFGNNAPDERVASYERLLAPIVEEANSDYGIELSPSATRLLAQALSLQLWGSASLDAWRKANRDVLHQVVGTLEKSSPTGAAVVGRVSSKVRSALGADLDDLTRVILFPEVSEAVDVARGGRQELGVILCHGYATASSLADAANRILRKHVFEAIDMTYEQELDDIIGPLSRLLARFSYCRTIVMLVDMGSLTRVSEVLPGDFAGDLYVANNVSTGLALEVGGALAASEDVGDALERAKGFCSPQHKVIHGVVMREAVAFCSEAGVDAADNIRRLVQDSLPRELPISLVTCDYYDLQRRGDEASVFGDHRVRVIVGTMDPGVAGVPFVALEDIIAAGSSDALDRTLVRELGPEDMSAFHARLLRNLTLKNVAQSITILNPEMLYVEADRAIHELTRLSGQTIDSRRQIGLYVHLCGLFERLVTKNFVDTYPDLEDFRREHADFIGWFGEAFADMSRRYRVEIPDSEVAYVYHMVASDTSSRGAVKDAHGMILEDE